MLIHYIMEEKWISPLWRTLGAARAPSVPKRRTRSTNAINFIPRIKDPNMHSKILLFLSVSPRVGHCNQPVPGTTLVSACSCTGSPPTVPEQLYMIGKIRLARHRHDARSRHPLRSEIAQLHTFPRIDRVGGYFRPQREPGPESVI